MPMYFIAIVLPQILDEKILQYKKWMAEKYSCRVGLKSPAHITIAPPFWMDEELEQTLVSDLKKISNETVLFNIVTDNFSSFPPRTLFIAIEPSENLDELKRISDGFFRNTAYGMKAENRPFHPHITIATRDLRKKDFWGAWEYFNDKVFREEFTAEGLSLLKHSGKIWEVVHQARFAGI